MRTITFNQIAPSRMGLRAMRFFLPWIAMIGSLQAQGAVCDPTLLAQVDATWAYLMGRGAATEIGTGGLGGSRSGAVSDDFNRANSTNMGQDWIEWNGNLEVFNNAGRGVLSSGWSYMTHSSASCPAGSSVVTMDLLPPGGSSGPHVAAIMGLFSYYTSPWLYTKIQDNNSDGFYDRIFWYSSGNSGGYGTNFFQDLTTPVYSGTATWEVVGDLLTVTINSGGVAQVFTNNGVSGVGATGTGHGVGTWAMGSFDNYDLNGGDLLTLRPIDNNTPTLNPNYICSYAQQDYREVTYVVEMKPSTSTALLTLTGPVEFTPGTANQVLGGVKDGEEVTVYGPQFGSESIGPWTLQAVKEYGHGQGQDAVDGVVFAIVARTTDWLHVPREAFGGFGAHATATIPNKKASESQMTVATSGQEGTGDLGSPTYAGDDAHATVFLDTVPKNAFNGRVNDPDVWISVVTDYSGTLYDNWGGDDPSGTATIVLRYFSFTFSFPDSSVGFHGEVKLQPGDPQVAQPIANTHTVTGSFWAAAAAGFIGRVKTLGKHQHQSGRVAVPGGVWAIGANRTEAPVAYSVLALVEKHSEHDHVDDAKVNTRVRLNFPTVPYEILP